MLHKLSDKIYTPKFYGYCFQLKKDEQIKKMYLIMENLELSLYKKIND